MAKRKLEVVIAGDASSLHRAFGQAGGSASSFGSKLAKAGKVAGVAFAALGAVAAVGLKKSVTAASDLSEQMNKTSVVFGKSAKDVQQWSSGLARNFGMSSRAALEATGTFGNMLVPMGFARDDAARMSKRMVELAGDMASFNNASPEDTLEALRAGLAGESEPLRKFGVFLNDARLKQEAMSLGLYKGKGALDANAKAAATYSLILKDSKDAQGDFAKTNDSFANAQRSMAASWENISASIGAKFLPVIAGAAAGVASFLDKLDKTEGTAAKFGLVMDTVKGLAASAFAALRAIRWQEVWDQIVLQVEAISPRVATALRGIETAAKTSVAGISTSWGQFAAASVVGAAVFAQSASKVVAAWRTMQAAILAANPAIGALTVVAGLLAGALYMIVVRGRDTSAALKTAESALKSLKSTADSARDANQNLAESKNRLKQASLNVAAAIKAKQEAVDRDGKSSQAAKQAEANVEAAFLARKRAAMDVAAAEDAKAKATTKANTVTNSAKSAVANLTGEYQKLVAQGAPIQATFSRIGVGQERANKGFESLAAKKYAADLTELAKKADASAKSLDKSDPALAAIARGVANAAREQAKLALQMGKIPGQVAKLEGPGRAAGVSVGAAIGDGIGAGIASRRAVIESSARAVVAAADAAARSQAEVKSPSRLFARIGSQMADGLAVGMLSGTQRVASGARALINASSAEVKRLQGILDGIANQRAAQDRARAVTDAAQAVAEARKKGQGVAEAERQLAAAREAIVIAGLERQLAREQGILERRQAAYDKALERLRVAVESRQASFQSVWDKFAGAAESAFDAVWGRIKTKSEEALDALRKARQEDTITRGVSDAQSALTAAQAGDDANAIVSAQRQLDDALLAQKEYYLEQSAAAERIAQDQQTAAERERFNRQLVALQTSLAKKGATQAEAHRRVMALFADFGIDYDASGAALGDAFAAGLRSKIKAVEDAAGALARAAAAKLSFTVSGGGGGGIDGKRAMGGPVNAGKTYLVGERGPELFTAARSGRIIPNGGTAAAGGGGTVVNVTVNGWVGSDQEIATRIQRELVRYGRRNTTIFSAPGVTV